MQEKDYLIRNRQFIDDVFNNLESPYFVGLVVDIIGYDSETGCYVVITCNRVRPRALVNLSQVCSSDLFVKSENGLIRIEIYSPDYLPF